MVNNYINGVLSSCIGKEDAYVKRKVEEAKFNSKQNDGNLAKYFSDLSTKDGRKLKNPKKVYAVVADQCQPRIGKGILRELDADIAVVIDTSLEKASLYSIGDTYDVSEFAKCFGGGGHKNASGFTLSYGWGQTTINSIMLWIHSLIA